MFADPRLETKRWGHLYTFPRGQRRLLGGIYAVPDPDVLDWERSVIERQLRADIERDGCIAMGHEFENTWHDEPICHFSERARQHLSKRRQARGIEEKDEEEQPIYIPARIKAPPAPMFDDNSIPRQIPKHDKPCGAERYGVTNLRGSQPWRVVCTEQFSMFEHGAFRTQEEAQAAADALNNLNQGQAA